MSTAREAALRWAERGYYVVPIAYREKRPTIADWPQLRIKPADIDRYFSAGSQNIGLILGDPYGVTDIDLDCSEAIGLWRQFAPPTGCVFGRASKTASHWLYHCDPPTASLKFADPVDKVTLLELRCLSNDGSVGRQTVIVPSTHKDSGEEIRYEHGRDSAPSNVDADVLIAAVKKTAAACVLARHWPPSGGGRHDFELSLSGVFARAGWCEDEAAGFIVAAYTAARNHDRNAVGRIRQSVADTFRNRDEGGAVTGFSRAISLMDRRALTAALDWLGIAGDSASAAEIGPTTWREHLLPGASGKPAGCLENAVIALHDSAWARAFRWNEAALRVDVCKPLPWEPNLSAPRQLADHDVTGVTSWMQREGIRVRRDDAAHAVDAISRRSSFHPIRDYFASLTWDGTERLNAWAVNYLGTEDTPYARAVGERFLIGAVARVMRPGSKVDTCLVLEGDQGIGKSSALRALGEPWFSDQLHDVGSKDAVLQMRGQLIVELAELDALSRAEASKVKQFLSSQVDNVRLPYARYTTSAPRECVFAGSVNPVDHIGYLRDETGNRRFWPLTCAAETPIDLAGLVRDKDQLWAEAVIRFNAGAPWWLHEADLVFDAARRTAKRLVSDPWDSKIATFVGGRECVTITDVLTDCLLKPAERWTPSDKQRVGRSLRKMGWECRRVGGRADRELAWFAPEAA